MFKLPGSLSCKGSNSKDYPYTKSSLINCNTEAKETSIEKLNSIVALNSKAKCMPPSSRDDDGANTKIKGSVEIIKEVRSLYDIAINTKGKPQLVDYKAHKAFPIESAGSLIRKLMWDREVTLSATTLQTVINTLESEAQYGNVKKITTEVRNYSNESSIYYNLNGEKVLCITKNGVSYDKPPRDVFFTPNPDYLPQIEPDLNSPPEALLSLLSKVFNVSDNVNLGMLSVYICSLFIRHIKKPLLCLYGQRGAAKSTAARLIHRIFHPSKTEITSCRGIDNTAIILGSNILTVFDNLSSISQDMSDLFCTALDGMDYQKRKNYTNSEVYSLPIESSIILTSLSTVVEKSDLIDRTLFIPLNRVADNERLTNEALFGHFYEISPQILGSIFNTLAKTLEQFKAVPDDLSLPRMAQFGEWGFFIAEILGVGGRYFADAFLDTRNLVIAETISDDPLVQGIQSILKKQLCFEGTATDLLDSLKAVTSAFNTSKLPGSASALSRALRTLTPDLRTVGIYLEQDKKKKSIKITSELRNNSGLEIHDEDFDVE